MFSWGRSAGAKFLQNSLFTAEKHCSCSHKFIQIPPNSSKRTGPMCVFKVFQKHLSSVSTASRRILQLLYLDVLKVDRCCISPPHLLPHLLSRRRQSIQTTPQPGPSESEAPPPSPLVARAARATHGARETEYSAQASIHTFRC